MALHGDAEWANDQLRRVRGLAIFDMDDGYFVGTVDSVMDVLGQFQQRLKANVRAILNPSKCELTRRII